MPSDVIGLSRKAWQHDSGKAFDHSFWRQKHLPSHRSNTRTSQITSCWGQHGAEACNKYALMLVVTLKRAGTKPTKPPRGHVQFNVVGLSRKAWQHPVLVDSGKVFHSLLRWKRLPFHSWSNTSKWQIANGWEQHGADQARKQRALMLAVANLLPHIETAGTKPTNPEASDTQRCLPANKLCHTQDRSSEKVDGACASCFYWPSARPIRCNQSLLHRSKMVGHGIAHAKAELVKSKQVEDG